MRKLILATVSALALGAATCGAGFAQQSGNNAQLPDANTPSATMPSATNPSSASPSPGGTMQEGTQSAAPMHLTKTQTKHAQQQLKTAGLYNGEIDGVMGPDTRQAIEQFQQKNGLQQTGRLDQQTLAALDNTGMNNGTSGAGTSALPSDQSSGSGGLNTGSGGSDLHPGASGTVNPSTTPNQH